MNTNTTSTDEIKQAAPVKNVITFGTPPEAKKTRKSKPTKRRNDDDDDEWEGEKPAKDCPEIRFARELASMRDKEGKPIYSRGGGVLYIWYENSYWRALDDEEAEDMAIDWLDINAGSRATLKSAISCVATAAAKCSWLPGYKQKKDINKDDDYNPHLVIIPLLNGYLHIKKSDAESLAGESAWSATLMPANRELGFTHRIKCQYDPFAEAPKFQKFLEEILPDKEVREYVREFAGYTLTADCRHQIAHVWVGSGSNGKSVLAKIISRLHEKVVAIALNNLKKDGLEGLLGGSLALADEIPPRIDENAYKIMTSGGTMAIPRKFKSTLSVAMKFKILALGNAAPAPSDQTDGFWRRTILINFPAKIKNPDPLLSETLIKEELPGILNWMVGGLVNLMERGHFAAKPKAVDEAIHAGKRGSNNVLAWVEDEQVSYDESTVQYNGWPSKQIIYKIYCDYCKNHGSLPVGSERFWRQLDLILDKQLPKNHLGYCGDNNTIRQRLVPLRIDLPSPVSTH